MNQPQEAIAHATARVQKHGYLDHQFVTDRDVTLFGFGFLAQTLAERAIIVKIEGKRFFLLGGGLGMLLGPVVYPLALGLIF